MKYDRKVVCCIMFVLKLWCMTKNGIWCKKGVLTNITKWSKTLTQFVDSFWTNCLSVFDHFVVLALKGLKC